MVTLCKSVERVFNSHPKLHNIMPYKDKEQQKEYSRIWKKARRDIWLQENGPCNNCGSYNDLEVDHINPNTKIDHKVWTWKLERRLIELAKCQVLCYDCHLVKSINEKQNTTHGTLNMYDKHNCRCAQCKAIKSIQNAKRIR